MEIFLVLDHWGVAADLAEPAASAWTAREEVEQQGSQP